MLYVHSNLDLALGSGSDAQILTCRIGKEHRLALEDRKVISRISRGKGNKEKAQLAAVVLAIRRIHKLPGGRLLVGIRNSQDH